MGHRHGIGHDDRRRISHACDLPGRSLAASAEIPLPTARILCAAGAGDPGVGVVARGGPGGMTHATRLAGHEWSTDHRPRSGLAGRDLAAVRRRGHVVASLPSLSLLTLAALTPEDIEVEYVEIPHIEDLNTRRLPDFDAVAISSYSAQIGEAYALADQLRAAGRKRSSADPT